MKIKRALTNAIFFAALSSLIPVTPAAADAVADFYKGRSIFLQIGAAVSGSYDTTGRLFARYMGKYIPGNPTIVVQNVAGLQLANQFGNTTPRDGTYFGVFNNGMPTTPLIDPKAGHFDTRKFLFLGSPNRQTQMLGVWRTSQTKTLDDLFTKETIVGVTAAGSASFEYPRLTNAVIGTKLKIIPGYQGMAESRLAMQRGEVEGTFVNLTTAATDFAQVIEQKDFNLIAAFGMKRNPVLGDVPLMPLGNTVEDRQLFELMYARQDYGLPFLMPPDVPADRAAALRHAFEATMRDTAFLEDAKKVKLDIGPVSADELAQLTMRLYQTPPDVIARMLKILGPESR